MTDLYDLSVFRRALLEAPPSLPVELDVGDRVYLVDKDRYGRVYALGLAGWIHIRLDGGDGLDPAVSIVARHVIEHRESLRCAVRELAVVSPETGGELVPFPFEDSCPDD